MFTLAFVIYLFRVDAKPSRFALAVCWLSDLVMFLALANVVVAGLNYWTEVLVPAINYSTGH
jgi:hypothetical protein